LSTDILAVTDLVTKKIGKSCAHFHYEEFDFPHLEMSLTLEVNGSNKVGCALVMKNDDVPYDVRKEWQ
jgi:hypothetical protein